MGEVFNPIYNEFWMQLSKTVVINMIDRSLECYTTICIPRTTTVLSTRLEDTTPPLNLSVGRVPGTKVGGNTTRCASIPCYDQEELGC